MNPPELDEVLHALTLATGALVAVVESGRAKETDQITFTGQFSELGSVTIKQVLDSTDAALGSTTGCN